LAAKIYVLCPAVVSNLFIGDVLVDVPVNVYAVMRRGVAGDAGAVMFKIIEDALCPLVADTYEMIDNSKVFMQPPPGSGIFVEGKQVLGYNHVSYKPWRGGKIDITIIIFTQVGISKTDFQ
jgi:hypothetical protein